MIYPHACEDGHEPITYIAECCPMCDLMVENEELRDEIVRLEDEIESKIGGTE